MWNVDSNASNVYTHKNDGEIYVYSIEQRHKFAFNAAPDPDCTRRTEAYGRRELDGGGGSRQHRCYHRCCSVVAVVVVFVGQTWDII